MFRVQSKRAAEKVTIRNIVCVTRTIEWSFLSIVSRMQDNFVEWCIDRLRLELIRLQMTSTSSLQIDVAGTDKVLEAYLELGSVYMLDDDGAIKSLHRWLYALSKKIAATYGIKPQQMHTGSNTSGWNAQN